MTPGVTTNPILTARFVAFPEPVWPLSHVPDLGKYDHESGRAPCLRCRVMVTSHAWAGQVCPGEAGGER